MGHLQFQSLFICRHENLVFILMMRGKGKKHVEARLMQEVTQGWVKHERITIKEVQEHTYINWRRWYHWKLVMMQVYCGKRELLDQQGIMLQKYKGWSPLRRKDEVGISPCRLCWLLPYEILAWYRADNRTLFSFSLSEIPTLAYFYPSFSVLYFFSR